MWLPGATEPVVAGRLNDRGPVTFVYGRSYLQRPDAVALYLPELPLQPGEMWPLSGEIAGFVADSAPDAWGRRAIIEHLINVIRTDWNDVCDLAAMPAVDRQRLWGRQFLNPSSLYGYTVGG